MDGAGTTKLITHSWPTPIGISEALACQKICQLPNGLLAYNWREWERGHTIISLSPILYCSLPLTTPIQSHLKLFANFPLHCLPVVGNDFLKAVDSRMITPLLEELGLTEGPYCSKESSVPAL